MIRVPLFPTFLFFPGGQAAFLLSGNSLFEVISRICIGKKTKHANYCFLEPFIIGE